MSIDAILSENIAFAVTANSFNNNLNNSSK